MGRETLSAENAEPDRSVKCLDALARLFTTRKPVPRAAQLPSEDGLPNRGQEHGQEVQHPKKHIYINRNGRTSAPPSPRRLVSTHVSGIDIHRQPGLASARRRAVKVEPLAATCIGGGSETPMRIGTTLALDWSKQVRNIKTTC
jgi:hypothetical protein